MKKIVLSIAILLGIAANSSAQVAMTDGNGIFNISGENQNNRRSSETPSFPNEHLLTGNQEGAFSPLGGGALLLIGFGAAYAMSKKRKQ